MGTNMDKKAARFGRWGLGIPRNIREGTAKYWELRERSHRRYGAMLDSDTKSAGKELVKDKVEPALDAAEEKYIEPKYMHKLRGKYAAGSNYNIRNLIKQYKQSSGFKRLINAIRLRKQLAQRSKYLEGRKEPAKNHMILRDLYSAISPQQLVYRANKHGYGIYTDVMPTWYKNVLHREMPAIVRKKMQLQRKGYKINLNPSDFGSHVVFNRGLAGMPQVFQPGIYNKLIANNADPFVPGMLYGAKATKGITALLQGKDVWFTPHKDVLQGYAGKHGRPYAITLNPKAQAVAGYSSAGKPLFTPHIASNIYKPQIRNAIQKGIYTEGRTAGRADWGNRPDYQAVAYLKPLREGAKNWRNTGQFRVFSKSKESDTGWQQIQPIITRDKYEHFRGY